jgi:hypothetical protein
LGGVSGATKAIVGPAKLLGGLWHGLASALGVAGTGLAGILVPLAVIAAAVAAGYLVWRTWGDEIKAAIARVIEVFRPVVATVEETIGGIRDAITAGDFGLAARIGLAGVKLAFLQTLDAVSKLVPDSMGEMAADFKSLGADVIQGNWAAVVQDLRALWASFTGSVVELMVRAATKVAAVWRSAVEGIANWMLAQSAKGGAMGSIMSKVIGVDLKKINERDKALAPERDAMRRRNLEDAIAARRKQMAEELAAGDQSAADESLRAITNFETELAAVGTQTADALTLAKSAVKQQMTEWQKATDDYLAAVDATAKAKTDQDRNEARDRAKAARERLGTRDFAAELAAEEANLAQLRAKAAAGAAKAKAGKPDQIGAALAAATTYAGAGGTYSAAAAREMWGTGAGAQDVQREMKRDTGEMVKQLGDAVTWLKKVWDKIGKGWL